MNINEKIKQFNESVETSLSDLTFVKLSLGNYKALKKTSKTFTLSGS